MIYAEFFSHRKEKNNTNPFQFESDRIHTHICIEFCCTRRIIVCRLLAKISAYLIFFSSLFDFFFLSLKQSIFFSFSSFTFRSTM